MEYEIEVTAADIEAGVPTDNKQCPVALALQREFESAGYIAVNRDFMDIDSNDYETPAPVIEFIDAFDDDADVKPFQFTIHIRE